jgi:chaperonin GroES
MLKPLNKNIIVEIIPENNRTASGLIIPGTSSKVLKGSVISIGDSSLRIGDVVVFPAHSGVVVKDADSDYLVIEFEELLAVVE